MNGETEPSNVWMDVQKIFQGLDEARVAAGVEPGPLRSAAIPRGCGPVRVDGAIGAAGGAIKCGD